MVQRFVALPASIALVTAKGMRTFACVTVCLWRMKQGGREGLPSWGQGYPKVFWTMIKVGQRGQDLECGQVWQLGLLQESAPLSISIATAI